MACHLFRYVILSSSHEPFAGRMDHVRISRGLCFGDHHGKTHEARRAGGSLLGTGGCIGRQFCRVVGLSTGAARLLEEGRHSHGADHYLVCFAKLLCQESWLGYGYSAFWVGTKGESANAIYAINWPRLNYAENGILELALELGIVGVGLYFLAYLRNYRRLGRLLSSTNGSPELFWYASIMFLAAITNIEAGYIAGANSMEWLIFVIVTAGIQKGYQEMRVQEESRNRVRMNAILIRSRAI